MSLLTSITVKKGTHEKLKKIAEIQELTLLDLMDNIAIFFEKTNKQAIEDTYSSKDVKKSIEKIVGFFRTQEKEYLRPALAHMQEMQILMQKVSKKEPTQSVAGPVHIDYKFFQNTFTALQQQQDIIINKISNKENASQIFREFIEQMLEDPNLRKALEKKKILIEFFQMRFESL